MATVVKTTKHVCDIDSHTRAGLSLRNDQVVIAREVLGTNGVHVVGVRSTGSEYLMVWRQKDRWTTCCLQREQLPRIGVCEHLVDARRLGRPRPDLQ